MVKIKKLILTDRFEGSSSNRSINDAGYLEVRDCSLARSGILYYRASDIGFEGGDPDRLVPVYRPAQEVRKIVDKYANMPLTLQHPDELEVRPDNARGLQVGHIGSSCHINSLPSGEVEVVADVITFTDAETIESVMKKKAEELSVGYRSRCKAEKGTAPDGTPYEAVQYDLVPNHVAVVEQGRCGAGCKVADSFQTPETKETEMNKVLLEMPDGKKFYISAELAQSLVESGKAEEMPEGGTDLPTGEEEGTPSEEVEGAPFAEEDGCDPTDPTKPCPTDALPGAEDDPTDPKNKPFGDRAAGMIHKIRLPNGKIGFADTATVALLNEMQNRPAKAPVTDSMEQAKVIDVASKVFGDSFDINKYQSIAAIKAAVVGAVLTMVDKSSLKDAKSLNTLYKLAADTAVARQGRFGSDLGFLTGASPKTDKDGKPIQASVVDGIEAGLGIRPTATVDNAGKDPFRAPRCLKFVSKTTTSK